MIENNQDKDSTAETPELQGIYADEEGKEKEAEGKDKEGSEGEGEGSEEQPEPTPEGEAAGQEGEPSDKDSEGEGEEAAGPPEKYEWNLPEGMEKDEIGAEQFEPLAREWGLSQKQLDTALEFYAGRMQQTVESVVDAISTQAEEQFEAWRKETLADKGIGKEGLRDAARFLEQFGGEDADEIREILNDTGLGNRAPLVRMFQRAGAAIAEDQIVIGQAAARAQQKDELNDQGIYGL